MEEGKMMQSKRPGEIYVLLDKIACGTFLNPKEFETLVAYIAKLEKEVYSSKGN